MLTQSNNQHVTPGENNAFDNLRPLESIMPLLDTLLDVELPFDRVSEIALICLGKIGNTRRCRYAVELAVEDGFAELPANCDQIDAVLVAGGAGLPGAGFSDGFDGILVASLTPDQIGGGPVRLPARAVIDLKQMGARYLDYTYRDGGLYVGRQASVGERVARATRGVFGPDADCAAERWDEAPGSLRVFYRGQVSDARGYPLITPEEALACAYFILSVRTQKRFFAREATGDQVQLAKQLSDQHVNQARVAPLASANGLDALLDQGKRHHRHFVTDDLYVN